MDNEALLAIRFSSLVGELMSSANVVIRVANLSLCAGRPYSRRAIPRSSPGVQHVFSEMSGSTTADVAVISRALSGPMKQEGYKRSFHREPIIRGRIDHRRAGAA